MGWRHGFDGLAGRGTRRQLLRAASAALAFSPISRLLTGTAVAQDIQYFRIGTGETGGSLFILGGVIAGVVSNPPGSRSCDDGGSCGVPGLIAVAQATAGSVENVFDIGAGQLDSGLCQSDVAEWAYKGRSVFAKGGAITSLRAIANLYQESLHVLVSADGPIKTLSELRGKTVGFGPKDAGSMLTVGLVLKAFGLSEKRLRPVYADITSTLAQFEADKIDAVMIVDAVPLPAIADLARRKPIALLSVEGEKIDALRDESNFLTLDVIPLDSYQGVASTKTLGVGVLWVVAENCDEALVYNLTKALWNQGNRKLLDESGTLGRQVRRDTALKAIPIPLHAGARRYYIEQAKGSTSAGP